MNFRKSELKDVTRILEIIEMAKVELKRMGLNQWQNGYPNIKSIENDIKKGISYVLEIQIDGKNKIVATIALSPEKEAPYSKIDGKWITCGDYTVIHRIAVDKDIKNQGIATKLLEFSQDVCLKNNIFSLRADTHENNEPMKRILEKQGFEYCGVIFLDREPDVGAKRIAFEKILRKKPVISEIRKKI
ncbi:GNAT family N-acetyltransferase [Leptotrichia sp. oral taxon 218]|jgi:acetyltransferase, GNAT family|uniref:GNAT family N-acetyltransferase n=1 Tax=Leptotrichia sp. oral taxon 218 TaxID=712361 RepID=UPI001B8BC849|nr:GNAT family N-acetyltransferase [Leptotrichia sp. oral taxon 218]QUB95954.1 GNAT family N-acetyltransferase [Leptotrichia sp. oral taxon 218]